MTELPARLQLLFTAVARVDRVVPPSGFAAALTVLSAAAMAFLGVFALALALVTGRLADRWADALAQTATVRISAPSDQIAVQTTHALEVLSTTPGVASARALTAEETRALLEPWIGPDLPMTDLPIPQLIEVTEDSTGFDAKGLTLRLEAEAPGAVVDDHDRWRRPLVLSAERIRFLGILSLVLIGGVTAAMITLAAQAALAANAQVIRVLRLIGARDSYIVQAFVRRFTLRALGGACLGTGLGMLTVALLPSAAAEGAFFAGLGFSGAEWVRPLFIVPAAALVAFGATRLAAFRMLRSIR